MDITQLFNTTIDIVTRVAFKALGALALWIIGRWLISIALSLLSKTLNNQRVDATLIGYIRNALGVVLNIILVVAILGFFGVETTSFAALIAAGGVAIGVAWGGLLSNFAAGAFLLVLRPFRAGDFITAGGVTGTVKEIGLFVTTLDTPDNIRTMVGNGKIFSDNIQNYSSNPYRRVDLVAQLSGATDHNRAIERLRQRVSQVKNVLADPAPVVEILEFKAVGPLLAIRPCTSNENYWQVYFDTNRVIKETIESEGYAAPMPVYGIKQL